MLNKTKIEWVKNPDGSQGYTWNPITGCLNNCPYCYARKLANGRLKARYLEGGPCEYINTQAEWNPFYPRFWPDRFDELAVNESNIRTFYKPKGVFVCDMSDLFGIGIPENWTRDVLQRIEYLNHWRFYLLTKQPQNLAKFSPFPSNAWVGVSATDYEMFSKASMQLGQIEARIKYISFEPLLNWDDYKTLHTRMWMNNINWLIIGAQTKPYRPPKIEWVKEIVEAADRAGVPVFLKNNLFPLIKGNYNPDVFSWAFRKGLLRQEMPKGGKNETH